MAAIVQYRAITKTAAGGALTKQQNNAGMVKKTVINIGKVLQKKIKTTKKLNQKEERSVYLLGEAKTRTAKENALEKQGSKFNLNLVKKVPNFAVDAFARIMNFLGIYLIGWITDKLPKIINAIKDLNQRIRRMGEIFRSMVQKNLQIMTSTTELIAAKTKQILTLDFKDRSGDVKKAQKKLDNAIASLEKDFKDGERILTAPLGSFPVEDGGEPGPGGKVQSGDLFEIIAGGEGGYESINRGNAGDSPGGARRYFGRNLQEMTVAEVMRLQSAGQVFAVGKYQIIPDTMVGFVRNMGIKGSDKFDAATQEKFTDYVVRFKRPEVGRYIRGESNNRAEAAQELAREFASVGLSYAEAGKKRGQSRYAGSAGNRASISPETVEAALDRARAKRGTPGAGDGSVRRPANPSSAYGQAVKVGRSLLTKGYTPWQHPDFNLFSGYTGSGRERVMRRSYNSYHNYGEALDYPLSHNTKAQLDSLAKYFRDNRSSLGVAEVLWQTANHYDHLHVSFKGGSRGGPLMDTGLDPSQGSLAPLDSGGEPPLDMEKLDRLIKMAMEKRAATAPPKYNADNVPSTDVPVSSLSNLNSMLFTSLAFQ